MNRTILLVVLLLVIIIGMGIGFALGDSMPRVVQYLIYLGGISAAGLMIIRWASRK